MARMRSADAQADPTSRRFWRLGLAQQLRQLGDVGGDAPISDPDTKVGDSYCFLSPARPFGHIQAI
jgi:hypothetical protein